MREYDLIAPWFAAVRSAEAGADEVETVVRDLPLGARVLDLGCGHGLPLARLLIQNGCRVVGVDSSEEMIVRFRENVPEAEAQQARIQDAAFAPESFDAVLAWGVWFHLTEADQTLAIGRVARWLRPGGRFLFTSGAERGERVDTMDGVAFQYVSLSTDDYREALHRAGLRLDHSVRNDWGNDVYLATKPPRSSRLGTEADESQKLFGE